MLPQRCIFCTHVLTKIKKKHYEDLEDINNNNKLNNEQKIEQQIKIIKKFNIHNCCCKQIITYNDIIQIILLRYT